MRKPESDPRNLLVGAVGNRRSLVHVRFDSDDLVSAINIADADTFVAEHSYMAESFLRSRHFGSSRFIVNTHVPEALVWRATRGVLGRIEASRLMRDELRVALAADAVATFDADEADAYRARGVTDARWLDLRLPPIAQVDVGAAPPRLVLMGTREWPPNQEAFLRALRLWPSIADGIDDAELCVIGAKKPGARRMRMCHAASDLGFVDDLQRVPCDLPRDGRPDHDRRWGPGEAPRRHSHGYRSWVTTPRSAAEPGFRSGFDDDEAFIAECQRLLTDRDAAVTAGRALFQANQEHWQSGRLEPSGLANRGVLPELTPGF